MIVWLASSTDQLDAQFTELTAEDTGLLQEELARREGSATADHDADAWRRIAARGLTHQAKTVLDRTTGTLVIRSVVDKLEAAAVVTPTTATTISTPTTGPHRPRGAARGAGFHLHAHATPPRWAKPPPDTTPD